MKKSKKWLIALMSLIPVVIIPVLFFVFGMNREYFLVIMLPVAILATITFFILIQRKMDNTLLQKRRKWLLIVFGSLIVFLSGLAIICYANGYSLKRVFFNFGFFFQMPVTIALFIWLFFRKDKVENSK